MGELILKEEDKIVVEAQDEIVPDSYIEEIEKRAETPSTDINVRNNNQLLPGVSLQDDADVILPADAIVLSATQTLFNAGIKGDVKKSGSWLTKWCIYMIKKYGNRVFFRGEYSGSLSR